MIRVALRGLAGRKLRAFLTALAIVLGVAMVSGTFVLTDMIDRAFNDIFTQSYANTDAYISGKSPDFNFNGDQVAPPSVEKSVIAIDGTGRSSSSATITFWRVDISGQIVVSARYVVLVRVSSASTRISHLPVMGWPVSHRPSRPS